MSYKRKIKEAILAFRIEKAYSKERILELYLNQIYLGEGTYGIAAASLEYFDKSVKELNYTESALLAALPKAPSKYNPFRYKKEAKYRRNLVLNNLNENGYITDDDLIIFKNIEIKLKKRKIKIINEANSYTEEVRRIINENYGFKKLYADGLAIKVPLEVDYQIFAQKALRKGIESYDRRHGWRGPVTNIYNNKNWKKKIKEIKIDPTLNWKFAKVINILESNLEIEILDKDKKRTIINKNTIEWAIKKDIFKSFKKGDVIYVYKNKNNNWELKQYPKVNGAISCD